MRFTKSNREHGNFDIVVTSMLDINFLLIMFFMMTAQLRHETSSPLDLPQERGEDKAAIDEAGLVINLTASGEIIVDNRPMELTELRKQVQAQIARVAPTPTNPVKLMIRADRNARSEKLNALVIMLRETGVGVIRVATEVPI